MRTATYPTVRIEHNRRRGDWEVELLDEDLTYPPTPTATCRTLDEARREAYRHARRQQPCELVICDAYHRVAHRELVGRR